MSQPLLTLTGVDGRTSASWMLGMGRRFVQPTGYSAIEFGILRSPKVGQSPRYPTAAEIKKITDHVYPGQLAFHLCGRYARMVHNRDEWAELCDIIDFSMVGRVQVNSLECDAEAMLALQLFSRHIGKPVVMQWRNGPEFPAVPRMHILQDRSGGQGIAETNWFFPSALCRKSGMSFGYAGGLNPENILGQLPRIRAAAGGPFWVDCESGIRTDDWLDQEKAEAMARVVVGEPRS